MIKELSELGKKIRQENAGQKIIHDALKDEPISIDLVITEDGSFHSFQIIEKIFRPAEAITAKKGKARLLLDKPEEVLCYNNDLKKHKLFIDKLNEYKDVSALKPVFSFYNNNKKKGLQKAIKSFETEIDEKQRNGNIAFRVLNDDCRVHEKKDVYDAIVNKFEAVQNKSLLGNRINCSVCGKADYPVEDTPHGMIKRVPDGQTSGCALVSYNDTAYESYLLKGNLNSAICTNCARTYTEGFNWLLSDRKLISVEDKKGKVKEKFVYNQRKNFGSDTAMVYWTRDNITCSELDLFDNPKPEEISKLIESVTSGKEFSSKHKEIDRFYSCTLSGAAARIAVRDWIELSLKDLHEAIAAWFEDIKIEAWGETRHPPLYRLAKCAQREKNKNDVTESRIASHLWNSSLKRTAPPLWILTAVLKRIRIMETGEDGKRKESVTPERAALIKLILNRNNKGGLKMTEKLDSNNNTPAYICGRIFSVLEGIQRAALGDNVNAGIRERFFSFASTNPSSAFGRLMKMSQNHLSKLKNEKAGLAVILDKELQVLFSRIDSFPAVFSLEEQGQFAIGYYHQKQDTFTRARKNADLKAAVDEETEVNE